jgi:expansin (peptidoglycan-binding protein)
MIRTLSLSLLILSATAACVSEDVYFPAVQSGAGGTGDAATSSGAGLASGSGGSSQSSANTSSSQTTGSGNSSASSSGSGGGACAPDTTVHQGQATWYELDTPLVNCGYETATLPAYYGAMNTSQYADSAICGGCVRVTGPKGSVDIQIVDQCPIATNPICYAGHIDLNPPAFEKIADLIDGIISIEWSLIDCEPQQGITYRIKEGSNPYWAGVRLRHHRYRVAKLEIEQNPGQFVEIPRESYNYFVKNDGMGAGPFTFRVTDVYGRQVIEKNVPFNPGHEHQGSGQFPVCN